MQLRRPGRQVERLLEAAEAGLEKLERSNRHAEISESKLRTKWLTTIEEEKAMATASIHILRWVLGIGLLPRELDRILTEPEDDRA